MSKKTKVWWVQQIIGGVVLGAVISLLTSNLWSDTAEVKTPSEALREAQRPAAAEIAAIVDKRYAPYGNMAEYPALTFHQKGFEGTWPWPRWDSVRIGCGPEVIAGLGPVMLLTPDGKNPNENRLALNYAAERTGHFFNAKEFETRTPEGYTNFEARKAVEAMEAAVKVRCPNTRWSLEAGSN